ncbi:hypothetical protein [Crocosphaera watsonii]|uniref:Uncharacterized protein n=1 Tax=Crocosphaera watsonii WH 0401 TaxID=555881 RepID=T2JBX3_CROWT|nr:hypothetical protein [Crocosphaera watsonii]CCQ61997.1 hypothetical protein CWATWH0401_1515 [Crocosphaera watsonii WH 0401]
MELLTSGVTAFLTLLATQTVDKARKKIVAKTSDQLVDIGLNQANNVLKLIQSKFPDKVAKLEDGSDSQEIMEAEVVKEIANSDDEIKKELEKLGKMIQENSEAKQVIENWKGINIKGGTNTISNNTLTFN